MNAGMKKAIVAGAGVLSSNLSRMSVLHNVSKGL